MAHRHLHNHVKYCTVRLGVHLGWRFILMLIDPGFPFCVNSSFARDDLPRMPAVHGRGGSLREITEGQAVHWTLAHRETSRLELI